eukprot:1136313-Pelagomonas_calceolata.AAC.14
MRTEVTGYLGIRLHRVGFPLLYSAHVHTCCAAFSGGLHMLGSKEMELFFVNLLSEEDSWHAP